MALADRSLVGLLHADRFHSAKAMMALAIGMAKSCDQGRLQGDFSFSKEPDFVAVWGYRPNIPEQLRHLPTLYVEAGYINGHGTDYIENRLKFTSVEWNGVAGAADDIGPQPPDRWKALGIGVKKWRSEGNRCLLLEQHPNDAASAGADFGLIRKDLEAHGYEVTARPHPLVKSRQPPLEEVLPEYDLAATYSSTAAVECLIAGMPVISTARHSVARDCCSHAVKDPVWRGDRRPFFQALGYRQWTTDELKGEVAWPHIRDRMRVRI